MDTELQYRVLFVKDAKTSHDFCINQLGFQDCGLIDMNGKFSPFLKDLHGNYLVLQESSVEDRVNIIITDDCLRDYFLLKQRNLQLLGKPRYQDKGLAIDFNDPSGTRFVLLEERDYSDA